MTGWFPLLLTGPREESPSAGILIQPPATLHKGMVFQNNPCDAAGAAKPEAEKAGELSEAHGEGPAEGFAVEGTRRFMAGKEVGRVSLVTFFKCLKKVTSQP